MKDRIKMILANKLGFEVEEIKPEALLKAGLLADELDEVEIINSLEKEFNVEIDDHLAVEWNTVQDVIDYMMGV